MGPLSNQLLLKSCNCGRWRIGTVTNICSIIDAKFQLNTLLSFNHSALLLFPACRSDVIPNQWLQSQFQNSVSPYLPAKNPHIQLKAKICELLYVQLPRNVGKIKNKRRRVKKGPLHLVYLMLKENVDYQFHSTQLACKCYLFAHIWWVLLMSLKLPQSRYNKFCIYFVVFGWITESTSHEGKKKAEVFSRQALLLKNVLKISASSKSVLKMRKAIDTLFTEPFDKCLPHSIVILS